MADLTWTATTDYSWIHISPDNGNGDAQIRITADKAPYSATTSELYGSVVISCTNCSSTIEKRISVTRCKKEEVTCNDRTTYEYSDGSVDKCGNWVMNGYEITTHYKDDGTGNCEPYGTPTSASTQDSGTTEENDKEYPRTISVTSSKFGAHELEQEAGPCQLDCGCDSISVIGEPSLTWAWNETGKKQKTIKISETCSGSVDSVSSSNNKFSASLDGNNIEVTRSEQNTTTEPITGSVTVKYTDKEGSQHTCENVISLTQYAYNCNCSQFDITSQPYSSTCVSNTGGTNILIAEYDGNCGGLASITSNSNTWLPNSGITAGDGKIYANISGNCGNERTATITIVHKANDETCANTHTVTVKQCKGPVIEINKDTDTLDCSGGTVTFSATIR